MTIDDIYTIFKIDDMMNLPSAVWNVLNSDNRDQTFNMLIKTWKGDYSKEWFNEAYETELAQRHQNKQDFTPTEISILCAKLTATNKKECRMYEPTAGTGSMLISKWHEDRSRENPFTYKPSKHSFECWELSDRAIPILLLNLAIRGMEGIVVHGDVLHQTIKAIYYLENRDDSFMAFSEIYKVQKNDDK